MRLTFDPEQVDAVVLDAGGVLVLPDPRAIRTVLESGGISHNDDDETFRLAHYEGMHAYDYSSDPPEVWDGYVDAFIRRLQIADEDRVQAARALNERFGSPTHELWIWAIDETANALRHLAEAGVPLAVVSNADGHVESALAASGVVQVGEGPGTSVVTIVDSGIVGIHKPDPRIFSHALEALGLRSERCLYVGDSVRNDVVGSRLAGLHPIHLDPFGLHDQADHDRVSGLMALVDALLG